MKKNSVLKGQIQPLFFSNRSTPPPSLSPSSTPKLKCRALYLCLTAEQGDINDGKKKMPSAQKQIFHINNTAHKCNTIEMSPRHRFFAHPQHRLHSMCSCEAPTEPIQRRRMVNYSQEILQRNHIEYSVMLKSVTSLLNKPLTL